MRFVEAAIEGLESLSPEMIEAELPDDSGGKYSLDDLPDDSGGEMANLGLSPEERAQFQQESGWSDQIMDSLRSPEEYRIYENAGLQEREVNGRRCLVRDDIDLEQVDEDGFTNADLMSRGRSPLAPNGGENRAASHRTASRFSTGRIITDRTSRACQQYYSTSGKGGFPY